LVTIRQFVETDLREILQESAWAYEIHNMSRQHFNVRVAITTLLLTSMLFVDTITSRPSLTSQSRPFTTTPRRSSFKAQSSTSNVPDLVIILAIFGVGLLVLGVIIAVCYCKRSDLQPDMQFGYYTGSRNSLPPDVIITSKAQLQHMTRKPMRPGASSLSLKTLPQ